MVALVNVLLSTTVAFALGLGASAVPVEQQQQSRAHRVAPSARLTSSASFVTSVRGPRPPLPTTTAPTSVSQTASTTTSGPAVTATAAPCPLGTFSSGNDECIACSDKYPHTLTCTDWYIIDCEEGYEAAAWVHNYTAHKDFLKIAPSECRAIAAARR